MVDNFPSSPPNKTGWPWTEFPDPLPPTMPDGSPWPKVSIVTPSYNQGQYLEETIRSVLLQGYPSLEYIIIDGGSTDNSVEIIKKYEPWLTYWVSEPDRGQSHAINKGFERCSGEYLAWLNSDDYYLPDVLHQFAKVITESNSKIDLIIGYCDLTGEAGNLILRKQDQNLSLDKLLYSCPIGQASTLISADTLRSVGEINESLEYVMDWELWVRIFAQNTNYFFIPEVLSICHAHEEAKTIKFRNEQLLEHVQVLRTMKSEKCLDHTCEKKIQKAMAKFFLMIAHKAKIEKKNFVALLNWGKAFWASPFYTLWRLYLNLGKQHSSS